MVNTLEVVSAQAVMPDQLAGYVKAIANLSGALCENCPLYITGDAGILVAYPSGNPLNEAAMNHAIDSALSRRDLKTITVLSPYRPQAAPKGASCKRDAYWSIDLPVNLGAKTRNMLKRALREVEITVKSGANAWSEEHASLIADFCARKKNTLDDGSKFIFASLDKYLSEVPDAILYSARLDNGELCACAIADFSALATAFYMFAFRAKNAPPGTADLLLSKIATEACNRGFVRLNLGLGIDTGIEFFKKKWGAGVFLPYCETTWQIKRPGFFKRLFGGS